jgi:Porin subfamily
MKMVKSLLLGSAAGLVAVTAGQAADLPVKAKPVEYVKVCSLYGAGFYYMPGTDLCMKVGGWARAEAGYGYNGNVTWGPYSGNANSRNTNNMTYRARGYITADVRSQSEYGTIRGYLAVGLNTSDVGLNTASNTFSANRAFVQFAGFTGGLSQSFYDYYSVPAIGFAGAYPASDTGDPGWYVLGYTAQLGNGLSLTVADEARRITQIINEGIGSTGGALPGNATAFPGSYGGQQFGDIVGNLRLDQAWGGGQIMGALHQVNANYYSNTIGPASGHPGDAYGWAAGVGLRLNFPMIAQGDFFEGQVNVTQGALRYIFQTANSNYSKVDGGTEAFGVLSDAVYGPASDSVHLTSAWNVNAGYDHYWLPNWHQSLYGGYAAVTYGATANGELCTLEGIGAGGVATAGCNNNWSTWWLGSRLQWDVTKTFYMGVEVLYENLHSGTTPTGALPSSLAIASSSAVGGTVEGNSGDWLIRFRAHRDFLP